MLYVYEFELVMEEGDVVSVLPFDFAGATMGIGYAEAAKMAADWLKTEIEYRLMNDEPIPEATLGNEPQEGGRVLIVAVDASLEGINTVSAKDAAGLLGVSQARVSQMIKEGRLVGYRKGRDVLVTMDSIKAQVANKPKVGRPRKRDLLERESVLEHA